MPNPNNTAVLLTVDTASITEANKDEKVTFTDNQSDDPSETSGSPSTYVSSVKRGTQLSWSGAATNGTTAVSITSVTKKTDSPVDILQSIGPSNGGVVTAVVNGTPPNPTTAQETYSVSFSFVGADNVTKSFTIDPRLKMR
jgi:hypothetical protein